MDFLMPFIIVIYLLSAIVTAVMKAMSASKQQQQKQMAKKSAAGKLATSAPRAEQQSVQDRTAEILADSKQENQIESISIRKKASKSLTRSAMTKKSKENSSLAHEMRRVLIMSELLREPRSRRPWPER
ncbi:MAG: hypothetical protein GX994_00490 [Firmicutes bacterium]|nr:hypothetical protein [Bacillota bacterium]